MRVRERVNVCRVRLVAVVVCGVRVCVCVCVCVCLCTCVPQTAHVFQLSSCNAFCASKIISGSTASDGALGMPEPTSASFSSRATKSGLPRALRRASAWHTGCVHVCLNEQKKSERRSRGREV